MSFVGIIELPRDQSAAFWSAYAALALNGVRHAEVRRDVCVRVMSTLLPLRHHHGMGHMLYLAQCHPEDRQHYVNQIRATLPEDATSATRAAVDAALVAAARVLAEG